MSTWQIFLVTGIGVLYIIEALVSILWPHNDKSVLAQSTRLGRIALGTILLGFLWTLVPG